MTAEEIRKAALEYEDSAWETAYWLKEIAAQLAEQTHELRKVYQLYADMKYGNRGPSTS